MEQHKRLTWDYFLYLLLSTVTVLMCDSGLLIHVLYVDFFAMLNYSLLSIEPRNVILKAPRTIQSKTKKTQVHIQFSLENER